MLGPASFICERTAEYALIPALTAKLREKYSFVIPVYPWMTREGSRTSKELHDSLSFRVLGLYARRPKLSKSSRLVHIKVNRELTLTSTTAQKLGIPMIAGCPLARNLLELSSCEKLIWLNLAGNSYFEDDFTITVDVENNGESAPLCCEQYSLDQVLNLVDLEARKMSFDCFIKCLSIIKNEGSKHRAPHPFFSAAEYKAVYILMANS